jgi:hypothetical protein
MHPTAKGLSVNESDRQVAVGKNASDRRVAVGRDQEQQKIEIAAKKFPDQ